MSQTTTTPATLTHDDHLIIAADALKAIVDGIKDKMAGSDLVQYEMGQVAEKVAEGFTDAELVSCWHVFRKREQDGDEGMRTLRFAIAHEHERRIRVSLAGLSSEEILARWEADTVPYSIGPGMLERSHQEACDWELEARLGEPLWEAMDAYLDEWTASRGERQDDEDEQTREARNADFRAGELEVYRRVIKAQADKA